MLRGNQWERLQVRPHGAWLPPLHSWCCHRLPRWRGAEHDECPQSGNKKPQSLQPRVSRRHPSIQATCGISWGPSSLYRCVICRAGHTKMKVKASIKRLCEACRIVKRRGRLYVICSANPKVCSSLGAPGDLDSFLLLRDASSYVQGRSSRRWTDWRQAAAATAACCRHALRLKAESHTEFESSNRI